MAKGDFEERFGYDRDTLWLILFKRQGGRCGICDERFTSQRRPTQKWLRSKYINIDHRRPLSHGGTDDLFNLQLTHKPCNSKKGADCEGCPECDLTKYGWDDER